MFGLVKLCLSIVHIASYVFLLPFTGIIDAACVPSDKL